MIYDPSMIVISTHHGHRRERSAMTQTLATAPDRATVVSRSPSVSIF